MNFYNPYTNFIPYNFSPTKTSFFKDILGRFNFKSIISGTQKTLNFVNQVIPAVKQISPIVRNAKTMFKVMNEFKKSDKKDIKQNITPKKNIDLDNNKTESNYNQKNNVPTFFL